MKRIGLISDTHSYLDGRIFKYFTTCDEVWHAGDFGTLDISDRLKKFRPLRGVYGNIDGEAIRKVHPRDQRFSCEGLRVWMTHIGGYPGRYKPDIHKRLRQLTPDLFICGHSHILKVMRDTNFNNMLHINPGAAGKTGLHKVRTVMRFTIDHKTVKELEVIELGKK